VTNAVFVTGDRIFRFCRDGSGRSWRRAGAISPSAFFKPWKKARETAGRPDLRFLDLRHTGAVLAAEEGAT
jgi:integrase